MGANAANAFNNLASALIVLFLGALLVRVLLQLVRADFYNPMSQAVWAVTNPLVQPLRRFVPRWKQLDIAACVVLWIATFLSVHLMGWLWNQRIGLGMSVLWTFMKIAWLTINLYSITLIIQAVLSWFGPGVSNPGMNVLWSLNEPLIRPIRRFVPPLGGLDFSCLIAMLALQFIGNLLGLPRVI